MPEKNEAIGARTIDNREIVGATARENLSGYRAARVFGVISPNTRRTDVMTAVAAHGPHVSPRREMNRIVATDAERMFTTLFATRSVESIRSGSDTSRSSRCPLGPSSASW